MDLKLEQLQIDPEAVSQQLAQFLKIPEKITKKAPSPDLIPGITDEFALGISYQKLDLILLGLDKDMGTEAIAKAGIKPEAVEYVRELIKKSEHMRGLPATPD